MAKKKNQPAPEPQSNPEFDRKLSNIAKKNGLRYHQHPQEDSLEMTIDGTSKKIIIKKAKIDKEMFLNVTYHESIILISGTKRKDIGGSITRDGENAIHDDLKAAFKKLNPHLALIAEMIANPALDDLDMISDEVKDFNVTGFSIGGNGDTEGVTLIGQRTLSTGKILNLTTPFEKWDGSEYAFINELAETIEECKHEVELYLNGKMAPPAQQEMDFETAEEETESETISGRDPLFEDAAKVVVEEQQGSASLIQRKLKIGYNRAGRIIDQLEEQKIIGPFVGDKARKVLIAESGHLQIVLAGINL